MRIGALSISIVEPPGDLPVGFDAADALEQGWTAAQIKALLATAKLFQGSTGRDSTAKKSKRPRQTSIVISLVEEKGVELWCDQDGGACGTFPVNSHHENWPIHSRESKRWIAGQIYKTTGGAIGGQALEDSLRVLEAKAATEGASFKTYRRIGQAPGRIYVDLCDDRWRAIEIRDHGWTMIAKPPCKFMRSPAMRPLAEPEAGGHLGELRGFVNASDADFLLVVGWLIATQRPTGPYPILAVRGEQGAGKSILLRFLRELSDPNGSPLRAVPERDRDLFVAAHNSWVLGLDNLSSVAGWLSDTLCRIATGGGFSARTLHSDREETFFELARPTMLNSIGDITGNPDLADRTLQISLHAIPETERRTEADLWSAFNKSKPRILGALFDAVSMALRNVDSVKMERQPRMADFAQWVTAAEGALDCEAGGFLEAYQSNRREMLETSFEADPVAVAVANFVKGCADGFFEGKASELLPQLSESVSETMRKSRTWPDTATKLGSRLRKIYPLLRAHGLNIQFVHSGTRLIRMTATGAVTSP